VTSTGRDVAAWLLLPLALYLLTVGTGLLVERITRIRLHNAGLAAVGFCTLVVVLLPIHRTGLHGWVTAGLTVAIAAAGFVLSRGELRSRLNPGTLGLAGLAVYLAYVAPSVMNGAWTWSGYNFVNDTAIHFTLVEYIANHGQRLIDFPLFDGRFPLYTHDLGITNYFDTDYPMGSHGLLAVLSTTLFTGPDVLYQGYLASMGAMAAMALAVLGQRSGLGRFAAPTAAATALLANLAYQYALQGSIKEVALLVTLFAAAMVGRELLDSKNLAGSAAVVAIACAASISVFSAAALPYVGVFVVVLVVACMTERRGEWVAMLKAAGVGAVVFLAVSLTAILGLFQFTETATSLFANGSQELGHLARPLPFLQSTGVWLSGDYLVPILDPKWADITSIAQWVIVLAAVAGIAYVLRKREAGPLLVFVPAIVTYVVVSRRVAPYADAKLLAVLGPAWMFAAAFAFMWLPRRIPRMIGAGLAGVIVLGVLVSAMFAYHDTKVAPTSDRLAALQDVGDRLSGKPGQTLFNEFEEFAKYYMRDANMVAAFEALSSQQVPLRTPQQFYGYHFDLDEELLEYVERFPRIVRRRSPDASRPPANFQFGFQNEYYEVWNKTDSPKVIEHFPLQAVHTPALEPSCESIEKWAKRAKPGQELAVAVRPELAMYSPEKHPKQRSWGWGEHPWIPDTVDAKTPGRAEGSVTVEGGRYRVWLRGSFGRAIAVSIDGKPVGKVRGIDTPGQYAQVATLDLAPGKHTLKIERGGGGSLRPSDGSRSVIGPLSFEPADGKTEVRYVDAADWRTLCGGTYDWIEIVER
jgi:hypothetical protein